MASFIDIQLQVTEVWEKSYYFWIAPRMYVCMCVHACVLACGCVCVHVCVKEVDFGDSFNG